MTTIKEYKNAIKQRNWDENELESDVPLFKNGIGGQSPQETEAEMDAQAEEDEIEGR